MKRPSHQRRLRTWLAAILIFVGLNMLLLVSYPNIVIAQKLPQSRQPVKAVERITRATLKITNRCPQPHRFLVSSDVKGPRFKQQTDSILVGASSTKEIEVLFDAAGLKSNLKAAVECLDCKDEEGCAQGRYEVPVEITAVNSPLKNIPPVKPRLRSDKIIEEAGVPGPGTGVLSGGVPVLGVNYVGVIPQNSAGCPPGSDHLYINMDDEDDHSGHPNTSSVTGWTGDIFRYPTGTTFGFCRVAGEQFQRHPFSDYAVLKLSDNCPTGSVTIKRLFDNEDHSPVNDWASGGPITPNSLTVTGGPPDWELQFCFFPAEPFAPFAFPNLHVPYGVFAAPSSSWFATGFVHTDDEDGNNIDATTPDNTPDAQRFAQIIYGTEAGTPLKGKNTNLLVAKVRNNTDCLNPCPYLGSFDQANCWVGKPPAGTNAVIYKFFNVRLFYWTPVNGNCPTWYDGAPCGQRQIPSYTKPFIWSNMWYVEPVCRP